jgi:hypothetical protein
MRRGLRAYVRGGYGGRATALKRFGGTVATADALHSALSAVAAGRPAAPGSLLDRALLAGRSAREVMDAVVEAVRPKQSVRRTAPKTRRQAARRSGTRCRSF